MYTRHDFGLICSFSQQHHSARGNLFHFLFISLQLLVVYVAIQWEASEEHLRQYAAVVFSA